MKSDRITKSLDKHWSNLYFPRVIHMDDNTFY